jgi:glutaconyl-CoA decarboxylase
MKMENEIFAPIGGRVASINCKEGDSVNTGDVLVVIS